MPRARVDDVELEYEEMGEGEPVVLIMGIGAQLVLWEESFCARLVERGFRVIRFDNRDCGRSTKLDDAGEPPVREGIFRYAMGLPVSAPYRLEDMARDVVGLLDVLGIERAHVVGASMGGMIAQTVAIRHPDRVRTLTSIMSGPSDRWTSIARPRAVRALFQPAARTRKQAMDRAVVFFREVRGSGFAFDEEGVRRRAAEQWDRGVSPSGTARQLAAVLASGSRLRALRSVRAPALVIHGSDDPLVPPMAGRATAFALPNAELRIIDGMGHDLPEGAWPEIVDAIAGLAARAR